MTRANNNDFTVDETAEIRKIKKFILENGFKTTKWDVLDPLAKLIYKGICAENLVMYKEYDELAATGRSSCSYRAKISYHIKNSFDSVKKSIKEKYHYDIGNEFFGVKNFVEHMVIAYTLYSNY